MERVGYTWALGALALSGLFLGITARKPNMIPAKAELLIQEGDNLIISCQGDDDIQFSYMDIPYHDLHWYYNVTFDKNSGLHTFIRPNATSEDTGWYACAYKDIKIKNDAETIEHPDENITWIYVYVNSSSIFAPDPPIFEHYLKHFIGQKTGGSLVIPCRLSTPKKLSVSLKHFSGSSSKLSAAGFQYDPKIGFIKHNVSESSSGTYMCHISHRHHYLNPSWFYLTMLNYEVLIADQLGEPLPPLVDREEFRGLAWGQNHTFNCHSADDNDVPLQVEWRVPFSVPRERLLQIHNDEMRAAQLTLFDAQESDRGDYTCTKIKRYVKSSVTMHAEFNDPDIKYINVTASSGNASSVTVVERTTAIWNLSIDTYPKAYTVEWMDRYNRLITNSSKYLHTQSRTNNTFKIFDATMADIGVYTLFISTLNYSNYYELKLMVLAQPVVRIVNSVSYHTQGQPAVFSCSSTGSPLPNITWEYLEYPDFPSKSVSKYASFLKIRDETHSFYFEILSHSTIRINATGDLTCRSCNVIGCSEVVEPVLVSDANGYFGVMDPGTVAEGDTVNLTCGASVYNFTNNIAWEVNNSTEHGRVSITNRTTKFTFQSILQISDVKISDSGEYVCRAENKENHNTTTVSYELSVKDARVPSISDKSTTNNTEIGIDLTNDEHAEVRLTCFARGLPYPEVTWLKDGKPLVKHSEQYAISKNNFELYIKYFRGLADGGNYSCQAKNRVGTIERYMNIIITDNRSYNYIIWISSICVLIAILVALIIYTRLKVKGPKNLKREVRRMALSELDQQPYDDSVNDEDEVISNNQESSRDRLIRL
ncbi:hemicentin-1-like [Diprion similis]|uniref:hemicentin-1-like n=1 Tax=Diprion similis TaxID=362088 RepID=UPI001EF8AA5A|nr:hemicentin-1-like [Diprion similis]